MSWGCWESQWGQSPPTTSTRVALVKRVYYNCFIVGFYYFFLYRGQRPQRIHWQKGPLNSLSSTGNHTFVLLKLDKHYFTVATRRLEFIVFENENIFVLYGSHNSIVSAVVWLIALTALFKNNFIFIFSIKFWRLCFTLL